MLKMLSAAAVAAALATTAHAQANLSVETSSPGNSPHLMTIHMAEVAGEMGIASFQVQEGQTLTNSVLNVAQGKTDFAPMPIILGFLLDKGRGPYSKQGDKGAGLAANLRMLWTYNAGAYGLMAHEANNIRSWEDIKGRTVFNGPPRGAALVNARQAIAVNTGFKDGDDYNGMQANWGQLATILVDGSADAFVLPLTFPSQRVTTALAAGNIVMISTPKAVFESDAFKRLLKAPGNVPIMVKWEDMGYPDGGGVTMISEDGTYRGMGTAFADIVHKDMSFELAKALTAAHIKTLDRFKARTPYAKNVNAGVLESGLAGTCGANPVPYHAGAVAAWEEAGYTVPDCAKP